MFGIRYLKAAPTTYVLHHGGGKLRREGAGLAFFYWGPSATITMVPLESTDVPFVFEEVTRDFQTVTVQGEVSFRVTDPKKLAALLDFTVDGAGRHRSDDPDRLRDRLVHATQVLVRDEVLKMDLREALTGAEGLAARILPALRASHAARTMGVEVLALNLLGLRPTPEMGRALEAEAREELHRRSDEAVYLRRNAAVDQERAIKENELRTEVAVEEKRREVKETRMAAAIAVEEKRATLVDHKSANDRKEADARAHTLRAVLEPVRDVDWKTLLAVGAGGNDPKLMIALAFRELAENAGKIGELNVTPDLLRSLASKGNK